MRKSELPALTGIRFYAAVFVFLSHVTIIPGMDRLGERYLVFNSGVVAVSFFFVLSGFILTYNYADFFRDGVSLEKYKRFVWDRLTKIYPVHFLALILVLPIAIFSPNLPLDWRALPFHLLLVQCFWPSSSPTFHNYLNVPSWSISCEWFFYILAPLAIFSSFSLRRTRLAIVLIVSYAIILAFVLWNSPSQFRQLYFVSWFAPSRFPEFMCGVLLGRFFLSSSLSLGRLTSLFLQIAGILLIVVGAIYRVHAAWPLWGGLLYLPGSILLVYGLAQGRSLLAMHLAHPWVRCLGISSFSLYMIHAPILRSLRSVFNRLGWGVNSWSTFAFSAILLFAGIQLVALFVCFKYEIPVQKALRRRLNLPVGSKQPLPLRELS